MSTTFLDIDLQLTLNQDGSFDYDLDIISYEWTMLGKSITWVDEGLLFSQSGTYAHQLEGTVELHPMIGYLVSNSAEQGAAGSYRSTAPAPIPEPAASALLAAVAALVTLRRRR